MLSSASISPGQIIAFRTGQWKSFLSGQGRVVDWNEDRVRIKLTKVHYGGRGRALTQDGEEFLVPWEQISPVPSEVGVDLAWKIEFLSNPIVITLHLETDRIAKSILPDWSILDERKNSIWLFKGIIEEGDLELIGFLLEANGLGETYNHVVRMLRIFMDEVI